MILRRTSVTISVVVSDHLIVFSFLIPVLSVATLLGCEFRQTSTSRVALKLVAIVGLRLGLATTIPPLQTPVSVESQVTSRGEAIVGAARKAVHYVLCPGPIGAPSQFEDRA